VTVRERRIAHGESLAELSTADREFTVRIDRRVIQVLDTECSRAPRIETGGILLGFHLSGGLVAVVTEATRAPQDSHSTATAFRRGSAGLTRLLKKRWYAKRRTFYVGEWHFHPANQVAPSGQDLQQMRAISLDANYHCKEPVLLIVGQSSPTTVRTMRAFVFPAGRDPSELLPA
jgi:hypothetical protein